MLGEGLRYDWIGSSQPVAVLGHLLSHTGAGEGGGECGEDVADIEEVSR